MLACTLKREDARDALILSPGLAQSDPDDPYSALPEGALIGCASVRRQAQMLHVRPDLKFGLLRGNVQTRLDKLAAHQCQATLLALPGLSALAWQNVPALCWTPQLWCQPQGRALWA